MNKKITLFVDEKSDSRDAQDLLAKAGVVFQKVHGHGVNLPKAQYRYQSYIGIARIKLLAASLYKE